MVVDKNMELMIKINPEAESNLAGATLIPGSEEFPDTEACAWVKNIPAEKFDCALVFGFGNGYHIEELLRVYPGRRFIVVELSKEKMMREIARRDLSGILRCQDVYLVVGGDIKNIASHVVELVFANGDQFGFVFLSWPPYRDQYQDEYLTLQREINDLACQYFVNDATVDKYALTWLGNVFANLEYSLSDPGVVNLFGKFKGDPCFIVSAGPSLDYDIEALKRFSKRALFIAAGSSEALLENKGLVPDFFVSIDATEENKDFLAGLNKKDVTLVYAGTVPPGVPGSFSGMRFSCEVDALPYTSWLNKCLALSKGVLKSGPSVANVAFSLALGMGCDPVILVGQDLAVSDGKMHCAGVDQVCSGPEVPVGGKDGGVALTDMKLYAMKLWFEAVASGSQCRIIDATGAGAEICGVERMKLSDISFDKIVTCPRDRIWDAHIRSRVDRKSIKFITKALLKQLLSIEFLAWRGLRGEDVFDVIRAKSVFRCFIEMFVRRSYEKFIRARVAGDDCRLVHRQFYDQCLETIEKIRRVINRKD